MSEPTPRPWRARRTGGGVAITSGRPGTSEMVTVAFCEDGETKADADGELIATAVNAHDALVEAVTALLRVIDIAGGTVQLSTGVQLGQMSWARKAQDAVELGQEALKLAGVTP